MMKVKNSPKERTGESKLGAPYRDGNGYLWRKNPKNGEGNGGGVKVSGASDWTEGEHKTGPSF